MTKQEEISQRIKEILIKPLKVPYQEDAAEMMVQGALNQAREILSYLHSQGVVIKVDRELPEPPFDPASDDWRWKKEMCRIVQSEMLKAGYVAVEPLLVKKI